ncbi:hypothetical protein RhiirA5_377897 [Rhizophagus irregularis]|uniref:Uncharacterized protein n=1 Tax=Rhizophagus irregularis TaxID=588596 RepID=A0A2N0PHR7_9GLOM|nr:hypothetical protein RhiirA5_377897 [Rhizophagus irregularis]
MWVVWVRYKEKLRCSYEARLEGSKLEDCRTLFRMVFVPCGHCTRQTTRDIVDLRRLKLENYRTLFRMLRRLKLENYRTLFRMLTRLKLEDYRTLFRMVFVPCSYCTRQTTCDIVDVLSFANHPSLFYFNVADDHNNKIVNPDEAGPQEYGGTTIRILLEVGGKYVKWVNFLQSKPYRD